MAGRSICGCRALVTGASGGIGYELARELGREGARVVVTARRRERLEQLVQEISADGSAALLVAGDITDPRTRHLALNAARTHFGGLDALINNAGVGAIGEFLTADAARLRAIMEVNFFAPVELIREAIPMLVEGTRPIVVNVGSVLGHRAVPAKSEYCASKFAVHGFSDALRAELVRQGIDVLLVSPSTTDSEFFDHVLESHGSSLPSSRRGMPPAKVARKVVRAMRRGKHEIILSPGGRALVWLDRLFPRIADNVVARFR